MSSVVVQAPRRNRYADRFGPGTWGSFWVRRITRLIVSLFVLVTFAFLMIHLIPGDPVRNALGIKASPDVVEALRHSLGLDQPLWQQYLTFWKNLLTGHLGSSIALQVPVSEIIATRLPATVEIAVLAFGVIIVCAIPIGLAAAALTRGGRRRGTEFAYASISGLLASIPEFLIGVGLVYLFAVRFQLFPAAGRSGPASFVLPVAALSIGSIAGLSRIVRSEAITVLDQDYIRTARAKRMPVVRVYLRHALPNILTSSLTIGGLLLSGLIAGTVLVENIFSWPGLGQEIVVSITSKDFPVAQAIVIVYGALVLIVNLLVDVLLALLDPRSTLKND